MLLKRIFWGNSGYFRLVQHTRISTFRSVDQVACGSGHEKDERSTLLWSHICFAWRYRSVFKRSKASFFVVSMSLALHNEEFRDDSWVVFIDHLECWNTVFCTLYETLHFAFALGTKQKLKSRGVGCSTLRD